MKNEVKAHGWSLAIFLGALFALWFILVNPVMLVWGLAAVVAGGVYYVVYLVVSARMESIRQAGPEEEEP